MDTTPVATIEEVSRRPQVVDADYLDLFTAIMAPSKRRSYELMRLRPGQAVLDLGCGPASDTIALARRVGPSGRVVGVDHDPAMVAEAARRAHESGVAGWTEHREADAVALPFAAGTFDAVRAERIFQHLPDPERAFAELVRVTKPGGWIVIADVDWATASVVAAESDLERRLIRYQGEQTIRNVYGVRRLYEYFARHGLAERSIELIPFILTDYAVFRYGLLLDEVEVAAVASGALSQAEVARLRADWERAAAAGGFLYTDHGPLIAGRKP